MARTIKDLSIAQGQSDQVKPGEYEVRKGKVAPATRLRCEVTVANASAGALVPSVSDRNALLGMLTLEYFRYGQNRQPFLNVLFSRLAFLIAPFASGMPLQGYSDSVTGMAQSIPASGSRTLVFYVVIPHGLLWMFPETLGKFGLGTTQAKTVAFKVNRGAAPALTAGLSVSGNVMVRVQPYEVSARGQRRQYVPEYREATIRGYKHKFEPMLNLLSGELTTTHDASAITSLTTKIDDEELHRDANTKDILAELLAVPNYPADADVSDVAFLFHAVNPGKSFRDLVPGALEVEQPLKQLADMQVFSYGFPLVELEEAGKDTERASQLRSKSLLAVSTAATEWKDVPQKLTPYLPILEVDSDDREYHELPGIGVAFGGRAELHVPGVFDAKLERAGAAAPPQVRASLAKHAARAVPGAATTARGINATSPIFARMLKAIGG